MRKRNRNGTGPKLFSLACLLVSGSLLALATACATATDTPPADAVNPLIGSSNGGNTYPGAVVPFGMLQWSPENTRGHHVRTASPSGYQYDARRIRGFIFRMMWSMRSPAARCPRGT